MKSIVVIALLLFSCGCVLAQDNSILYLNADGELVAPAQAKYYRKIEKQGEAYLVKTFFKDNDKLEMEGTFSEINPRLKHEGACRWYYENGQLKKEKFFVNDVPRGISKTYYENGQEKELSKYDEEGHQFYLQHWDEKGIPQLTNGTGVFSEEMGDGGTLFTIEIYDSLVISSFHLNDQRDSIYFVCENSVEYEGGLKAFYQKLGSTLKYPAKAQKEGVEGKVFIEFEVGKNGEVRNAKVLKGIGAGCDEEALQGFLKQKKWIAATSKGKPVIQKMVLPVQFRLDY
jgi:TonB family protein